MTPNRECKRCVLPSLNGGKCPIFNGDTRAVELLKTLRIFFFSRSRTDGKRYFYVLISLTTAEIIKVIGDKFQVATRRV